MLTDIDIFTILESKQDSKFIIENANLALEAVADVMETSADIPFVGSLIKLAKVGLNFIDLQFIRKLGKFLKESQQIPEEKKETFIQSLDSKDKKRISKYLIQFLYQAEEDAKAELLGKIYKYRLLDKINNSEMLRLSYVVSKSFMDDLYYLEKYSEENDLDDYVTDNLVALGILKDCGNMYEESEDGWKSTSFGTTKHQLNKIGRKLLKIIKDEDVATYEQANEEEILSIAEQPQSI